MMEDARLKLLTAIYLGESEAFQKEAKIRQAFKGVMNLMRGGAAGAAARQAAKTKALSQLGKVKNVVRHPIKTTRKGVEKTQAGIDKGKDAYSAAKLKASQAIAKGKSKFYKQPPKTKDNWNSKDYTNSDGSFKKPDPNGPRAKEYYREDGTLRGGFERHMRQMQGYNKQQAAIKVSQQKALAARDLRTDKLIAKYNTLETPISPKGQKGLYRLATIAPIAFILSGAIPTASTPVKKELLSDIEALYGEQKGSVGQIKNEINDLAELLEYYQSQPKVAMATTGEDSGFAGAIKGLKEIGAALNSFPKMDLENPSSVQAASSKIANLEGKLDSVIPRLDKLGDRFVDTNPSLTQSIDGVMENLKTLGAMLEHR